MGNDNVYQPGFMTRRSFVKAAAAASGAAALAGLVGCGTQAASGAGMVSTCSKLPRRWQSEAARTSLWRLDRSDMSETRENAALATLDVKPNVYWGKPIESGSFTPSTWGFHDIPRQVATWLAENA